MVFPIIRNYKTTYSSFPRLKRSFTHFSANLKPRQTLPPTLRWQRERVSLPTSRPRICHFANPRSEWEKTKKLPMTSETRKECFSVHLVPRLSTILSKSNRNILVSPLRQLGGQQLSVPVASAGRSSWESRKERCRGLYNRDDGNRERCGRSGTWSCHYAIPSGHRECND